MASGDMKRGSVGWRGEGEEGVAPGDAWMREPLDEWRRVACIEAALRHRAMPSRHLAESFQAMLSHVGYFFRN